MITALTKLLVHIVPSMVIEKNCIELIQRERVGIAKYGVSLTDAKLTHEQVLQHLLEEQLDAANYTRKALMTASTAHVDYAMLRKEIERALFDIENLRSNRAVIEQNEIADITYSIATSDAAETLKDALFRFDSEKVRRDLRK